MKILRLTSWMMALVVAMGTFATENYGQRRDKSQVNVSDSVDTIEVIANSAKRLTFKYDVPDVVVENDSVIRVRPVARNELMVVGLRPGVTAITVSNPQGELQHVEIQVIADARELQRTLDRQFPSSNVRAIPMKQGVMLTGTIGNANDINTIVELASDYFPARVINRTVLDGSQMVAIEVKVYEVSRTKLRRLGVDWAVVTSGFNIGSSVAGIITQLSASPGTLPTAGAAPITFGVLSNGDNFQAFIDTLEQRDMAKLLDQPTLVAINGRAAEFLSGGEIPIQVAAGLGVNSVEFRPFGTKLDIVPKILGGGRMRLELRAEVSEVANDLSGGTGVPGFRVRRINTGVTMRAGHTLALAGDYREEVESQARGIPGLLNLPAIGTAFRRTQDTKIETELVFLITPRFISDVAQDQVPQNNVGRMTTNPSNQELYFKGHIEVPKCGEDCPTSQFVPNASQNLDAWRSNIRYGSRSHRLSDQAPGGQSRPLNMSPSQSGTPAQPSGFNRYNTQPRTAPANSTSQRTNMHRPRRFGYPKTSRVYAIGDQNRISSIPSQSTRRKQPQPYNPRSASYWQELQKREAAKGLRR